MSADIHALELEFAKHPSLDASLTLCDAYLIQKRFMEAMVVCKKGIKAAPADPRGRFMLARIYFDQGKTPKAQQELTAVLSDAPKYPEAIELMGRVVLEQGQKEQAARLFQQALALDPTLSHAKWHLQQLETLPALSKSKAPIQVVSPQVRDASAAVPPAVDTQVVLAPVVETASQPTPLPDALPPSHDKKHVGDFFAPETLGFKTQDDGPAEGAVGRRLNSDITSKRQGSLRSTLIIGLLASLFASAAIVWVYFNAKKTEQVNALYNELEQQVLLDTFAGYRRAAELADSILAIEPLHTPTLAALAFSKAVLAVEHGLHAQLDEADALLQRAAVANDTREFAIAASGLLAFARHDYDSGYATLRSAVLKGATHPYIDLEAFRLLDASQPNSREARSHLSMLSDSSNVRVHHFLGWYYLQREDFTRAQRNFAKVNEAVPNHPQALIGLALTELGRPTLLAANRLQVEQWLQHVFDLKETDLSRPTWAWAYFAQATYWHALEEPTKSAESFARALELDPENALFFYQKAVRLLESRKYIEAISELKKAIHKRPEVALYHVRLAEAQMRAKLYDDAVQTLDRAVRLGATPDQTGLLRGELLVMQKRYAEALVVYKEIKPNADTYPKAQLTVARALRLDGKAMQATTHLEETMPNLLEETAAPLKAQLWCELGLNYEALNNLEKAMAAFETGTQTQPDYADCYYYKCRASRHAQAACEKYLELEPQGSYAAEARLRLR